MSSEKKDTFLWQPSWTEEVKIESGGRYPLGLNRFHNGLETFLIKGIVYTANRLRYITYYCWAIGDIQESVNCEQYSDFVEAFRLRENALALGLYLNKPEFGVVGSRAISHIVSDDLKEYDCSFELMQSNQLGGFGLYYSGTMDSFGLIQINENGIYELSETGKKIYQIYLKRIQNTKYFQHYKGKKIVPTEVLLEWGIINDLNNIVSDNNKDEREFYQSLIFHLDQKKSSDFRRESFSYFLECILQCSKNNTNFDEIVLRNTHFYSQYYDDQNVSRDVNIPDYFNDSKFYWKIYEGHAYFRWWLSKLFQYFLRFLKSNEEGATIDGFFNNIEQEKFNEAISYFCQKKEKFFSLNLERIISSLKSPKRMAHSASEESLFRDTEFESLEGVLAKCLLTLINLFLEFNDLRKDKRYQHVEMTLLDDLWFGRLYFDFPNIRKMSVKEFLKKILGTYIISQHDRILLEKNDLRRCWFTTERIGSEEKFYFQSDSTLIFRPAKYETI
ncbi:hypothetical protein ACFLQZ_02910, partial [Acidobacteriota bacterium]